MESNQLDINTRQQLREWLQKNHNTAKDGWVACLFKKEMEGKLLYLDLVEECLCFGWIDSTQKSLGDGWRLQRISPRGKKSNWTQLNKERVERLQKLGLMTEAGYKILPDLHFTVMPQILQELQSDKQIWENYQKLPELYKRIRLDNIQVWYNKDKDLYQNRLQKFLDNTKLGLLYGEWNDNGRLLEFTNDCKNS